MEDVAIIIMVAVQFLLFGGILLWHFLTHRTEIHHIKQKYNELDERHERLLTRLRVLERHFKIEYTETSVTKHDGDYEFPIPETTKEYKKK